MKAARSDLMFSRGIWTGGAKILTHDKKHRLNELYSTLSISSYKANKTPTAHYIFVQGRVLITLQLQVLSLEKLWTLNLKWNFSAIC